MADILEMKMPSPGESITEVEVAQLLVSNGDVVELDQPIACLLYTSPSPRDGLLSRMPSSA